MPTGPDDWFRSDAWDDAARAMFESRLSRARSSRAQYLRIKGLALLHTGDPERVGAGRVLSQRVIDEHATDLLQTSAAHYALGESFAQEGSFAKAIEHLRVCLAIEARCNARHDTELRLAEVLIQEGSDSGQVEALDLLDIAASRHSPFQVTTWRIEIARARVYRRMGDSERAATHARSALDQLAHNDSRFARHPGVGVIDPDGRTLDQLRRLADGT